MATTGLTRTSFYRYFPDLEAVLLRWLSELGDELRLGADSWLQDPGDGPRPGSSSSPCTGNTAGCCGPSSRRRERERRSTKPWSSVIGAFTDRYTEFIAELCRNGSSTVERPEQTARALVGMTERYLLDTYGRGPAVDVHVAAATLAEIWQRTLFSAGVVKPPVEPGPGRPPSTPVRSTTGAHRPLLTTLGRRAPGGLDPCRSHHPGSARVRTAPTSWTVGPTRDRRPPRARRAHPRRSGTRRRLPPVPAGRIVGPSLGHHLVPPACHGAVGVDGETGGSGIHIGNGGPTRVRRRGPRVGRPARPGPPPQSPRIVPDLEPETKNRSSSSSRRRPTPSRPGDLAMAAAHGRLDGPPIYKLAAPSWPW